VLNGDILCDVDLSALWNESAPAVMALRHQVTPRHTPVALSPGGTVTGIHAIVGQGDPALHFTGVHVLDRAVLDRVPPGEQCIVRTAYRELIPLGQVRGRLHTGAWTDIGTIAEYDAVR
jgi:NDP-sugar pyrophosphorylase family protein